MIAWFLVTTVRIFIGGLLSCLVSSSSSVPELTCRGVERGLYVSQSLAGGGYCKSVVWSVSLALHVSALSLSYPCLFPLANESIPVTHVLGWGGGGVSGQGGVLAFNSVCLGLA